MLVFGVDIPLVEVIIIFGLVIFLLLAEAIIVIALLVKHLNKTKKLSLVIEKLSETMLEIKRAEIDELDRLRRR